MTDSAFHARVIPIAEAPRGQAQGGRATPKGRAVDPRALEEVRSAARRRAAPRAIC